MKPIVRSAPVILLAAALAACGSAAVEDSQQYVDLLDERDDIATDLVEVQTELDAALAANDDLDDQLAVSEARLADAAADATTGADLSAYLGDFLRLDLENRAGFSDREAGCVTEGFLADADAREAYLLLIDPSGAAGADEAEAALERMTAVMRDCGIDVPDEPETAGPSLADVVSDVDVVGQPLSMFGAATDAAIGVRAPVLVGSDYDGRALTVDASVDGPTMLIFLAHWCPHCNAEIPKINQLRDEGRIPDGVNIVAVSSLVSPDRANYPPNEWLADADWTFPTLVDGLSAVGNYVAAEAFGLQGVPYTILLDADGVVTARWAGERPITEIEGALISLAP